MKAGSLAIILFSGGDTCKVHDNVFHFSQTFLVIFLCFSYIFHFEILFINKFIVDVFPMFLNEKNGKAFFWHEWNPMFFLCFFEKHKDLRNIGKYASVSHLRNIRIFCIQKLAPIFFKWKQTKNTWEWEMQGCFFNKYEQSSMFLVCFPYISLMFLLCFSVLC